MTDALEELENVPLPRDWKKYKDHQKHLKDSLQRALSGDEETMSTNEFAEWLKGI